MILLLSDTSLNQNDDFKELITDVLNGNNTIICDLNISEKVVEVVKIVGTHCRKASHGNGICKVCLTPDLIY